jgi:hypothetical protein
VRQQSSGGVIAGTRSYSRPRNLPNFASQINTVYDAGLPATGFTPTTRCTGSTTPLPTARTTHQRTWRRASLPTCAGPRSASITISVANTLAFILAKWLGKKTIAARQTGYAKRLRRVRRCGIRLAGFGQGSSSGFRKQIPMVYLHLTLGAQPPEQLHRYIGHEVA